MLSISPRAPAPLRVLHVLEATLGGTMRYVRDIAEASCGLPIEIGFAYAKQRSDHQLPAFLTRASDLGWHLFSVDMAREISPWSDLRSACALAGVVRRFRPDIIHCHSSKAGALGRVAALSITPRPKIVYSPHAIMAGKKSFLMQVERLLGKMTDTFVAVTEGERQQLAIMGITSLDRIEVICPFIDTEVFEPRYSADPTATSYRAPHIVGVGRLCSQKAPLDFLRIIAELRRHVVVTATWIGDGELRCEFEAERHDLQLDRVVNLTGWIEDVRPQLGSADALLSTSRFESFGYMVAEAMAMAVPVVATRIPGTLDIVGDQYLHLYRIGDVETALAHLADICRDRPAARRRAEESRADIKRRFSKAALHQRLAGFYRESLPAIAVELACGRGN